MNNLVGGFVPFPKVQNTSKDSVIVSNPLTVGLAWLVAVPFVFVSKTQKIFYLYWSGIKMLTILYPI
jgi:hypothetical protein